MDNIIIKCFDPKYEDACYRMLVELVPQIKDSTKEYRLNIGLNNDILEGILEDKDNRIEESIKGCSYLSEKIRLIVLRLATRFFSLPERPWGILLGQRPSKVVHRLLDERWSKEGIVEHLKENYGMAGSKAELVTDIALRERPFFLPLDEIKKKVGIYIGIPFCPTRCSYCSFPAYALKGQKELLQSFLKCLYDEIKHIGAFLRKNDVQVESVYVGGGTPTTLSASDLDDLLALVRKEFSKGLKELTVEAGRPDTITEDKLLAMKRYGVDRISINPQTMCEKTLDLIGRRHTEEDIIKAMAMTREAGFDNINMDIIIGLPGEDLADLEYTLGGIEKLRPESITCHTMALKRASKMKEERIDEFQDANREIVEKMMDLVEKRMAELEYLPYYLYRQREILANLENVGYAILGKESIYNVQMMEERQTIIGLGGGSVSKTVAGPNFKVKRMFNPKDPKSYIEKAEELYKKKEMFLAEWLVE